MPCTVNGVKMKFVFDTGAAMVSMSQSMAQFLLDGEYLSVSDIKGTGKFQMADGRIVNGTIIMLRDIEIGGMHIHNIKASVSEEQNAPLLLGQTAIQELGRVSIEGNKLIIHSVENELTEEQIEELGEQIDRLFKTERYSAAIDCLLKMEVATGLSEYGLWKLCWAYRQNRQWEECIQTGKRWLMENEKSGDVGYKKMVYDDMADSYYFGRHDYNNALLYYQKTLDVLEDKNLLNVSSIDYTDNLILEQRANCYHMMGSCYDYLGVYYKAIPNYKKAIKLRCEYLDVTMEMVQKGEVQDEVLGVILFSYAFCYYFHQNKQSEGNEIMKISALCGYDLAIDHCRELNIDYQVRSSKLFE